MVVNQLNNSQVNPLSFKSVSVCFLRYLLINTLAANVPFVLFGMIFGSPAILLTTIMLTAYDVFQSKQEMCQSEKLIHMSAKQYGWQRFLLYLLFAFPTTVLSFAVFFNDESWSDALTVPCFGSVAIVCAAAILALWDVAVFKSANKSVMPVFQRYTLYFMLAELCFISVVVVLYLVC
jgi:hypothetical protein